MTTIPRRGRGARALAGLAAGGLLLAGLAGTADAKGPTGPPPQAAAGERSPVHEVPVGSATGEFRHLSTFDVISGGNSTLVAEILDVTDDGNTLVYTDSPSGVIGFVDITDPANPTADGTVTVPGEPTSVAVAGDHVLAAVNTSPDFDDPSGELVVIDLASRSIVASHALAGQPDSVALAPDGKRAAIVIENERDEDEYGGLIPQAPTGGVQVVKLAGTPSSWKIRDVDLSPVAAGAFAGDDLEPEYVDINDDNLAVVSFQENNHLAVVDIKTRKTVSEFSAGAVELSDVDAEEEDLIELTDSITKRREPDAVAWIDHDSFATANEGDYENAEGDEGGSRGFTIFNIDGTEEDESAEEFEHLIVSLGHYNEGRSENKGVEPESVEVGIYGGRTLLFVASERSNVVGVYEIVDGQAQYLQALPTGIGPEGLKAIPSRDLFIVGTESDEADDGIPTMINIYEIAEEGNYPQIVSADDEAGLPIPWVALSGLVGHPTDPDTLYAVSDSALAEGFIYTIDVSSEPAVITDRVMVDADIPLDLEGIAVDPSTGNFFLGSEGAGFASDRDNLVLEVRPDGVVLETIALPTGLVDERRSNGIEGIAVTDEYVYVAIQRAWPNEGDSDAVNTKIGRYDRETGAWTFVHYELEAEGAGDWIGLSELTLLPDGTFAVIERDKGWGPSTGFVAGLKAIYQVDLTEADFQPYVENQPLPVVPKTLLRDVLPDLAANSIFTPEKLEGLAVAADGDVYLVTDNDGVDDAPGETVFLGLGHWTEAFGVVAG